MQSVMPGPVVHNSQRVSRNLHISTLRCRCGLEQFVRSAISQVFVMSSQLRSYSAPPWAVPLRPASFQDHELLCNAHAFLQVDVNGLHTQLADMNKDLDALRRTFSAEKAAFIADNAALKMQLGNLLHRLHKVETRVISAWLPDPEPEPTTPAVCTAGSSTM